MGPAFFLKMHIKYIFAAGWMIEMNNFDTNLKPV